MVLETIWKKEKRTPKRNVPTDHRKRGTNPENVAQISAGHYSGLDFSACPTGQVHVVAICPVHFIKKTEGWDVSGTCRIYSSQYVKSNAFYIVITLSY